VLPVGALPCTHLAGVIARRLAKSADDRHASAEDCLAALDGCPEALGRRASHAEPVPTVAGPVHFDVRPFLKRSRKWLAAGLGALILIALIYSALSNGAPKGSTRP
jgi:hypothetical protein